MKWRLASRVLCDKKVLQKLKDKFYRVVVRPTMLYRAECWPIKNFHVQKMKVVEMRILQWMCGNTGRDRIRNENIRGQSGNGFGGGQVEESEIDVFRKCEKEIYECPNAEV